MAKRLVKDGKKPRGSVYVGPKIRWLNPFDDLKTFERWVRGIESVNARIKRELRGKDLVCDCPLNKPCHGDILLRVANEKEAK